MFVSPDDSFGFAGDDVSDVELIHPALPPDGQNSNANSLLRRRHTEDPQGEKRLGGLWLTLSKLGKCEASAYRTTESITWMSEQILEFIFPDVYVLRAVAHSKPPS